MSVALYMDAHVPAAITRALMARGVDVLTHKLIAKCCDPAALANRVKHLPLR